MTQHSIPALQAMTSLQQAASSEHHAVSNASSMKVSHAKASVSFTVLTANVNQIVLQDNANKQRFSLSPNALTADIMPKGGDTLVLISANDAKLNFRLIPSEVGASGTQGQAGNLPAVYNRSLIDSWPGLNLSVVSKVPLSVSAQTRVNRTDPSITQLATILSLSATKLGQPSIELPVLGKVVALQQVTPSDITALVKLPPVGTDTKQLNIALPLPKNLQAVIKPGSNIEILLSPNYKNAAVQGIKLTNGAAFSNAELRAVNAANAQLNQKIQQVSAGLLFSKSVQPLNQTTTTSLSYVQSLSRDVLNALPTSFAAHVKHTIPAAQIDDARLMLITDKNITLRGSSSTAPTQITLAVVAKPQMVQIATQSISHENVSRILGNTAERPSISIGKAGVGSLSSALQPSGTIDRPLQGANGTGAAGNANTTLLERLSQRLSASDLDALSPKLQSALNHTLSHSEPGAPVMKNVMDTLNNILGNASKETRALLRPLHLQLSTFIGDSATAVTNIPSVPGASQAKVSDGNSEPLPVKLNEILRASMSTQAVTQITHNTQSSNQNSFIEGLVSLLKLSLAAKLSAGPQAQLLTKNTDIAPNISAFASNIIKQNQTKPERLNTSRILQDIALSDPRGSLISEIGKLLSSHNTHKLRSAEASLQGQDTFYYSLPNMLNPEGDDIEIAIKREKDQSTEQQQTALGTAWKLDMKLDAGKYGTVLAKTRFNMQAENQGVDLHLYTSNEPLKSRVLKYLPILHSRLNQLGIHINSQKCDVGKIDASLFKTQLDVMHTYA